MDLNTGPKFQGLDHIRVDDNGSAVGVVNLHHWRSVNTSGKCKAHLNHPTDLDVMLKLAFPALSGSGLERVPAMVPTCISDLWISDDVSKSNDHHQGEACAKSKMTGPREVQASLIAGYRVGSRPDVTLLEMRISLSLQNSVTRNVGNIRCTLQQRFASRKNIWHIYLSVEKCFT